MIRSFDPIADGNSRILILGTIPGKRSLEANEYYANHMNAFWSIIYELFGSDIEYEYQKKKEFLLKHRTALWDVLNYCERKTSADSDIKDAVPNDFIAFFRDHPGIRHVFFNGSNAERLYMKHVARSINDKGMEYMRLLSTSSANASYDLSRKADNWKVILTVLNKIQTS